LWVIEFDRERIIEPSPPARGDVWYPNITSGRVVIVFEDTLGGWR